MENRLERRWEEERNLPRCIILLWMLLLVTVHYDDGLMISGKRPEVKSQNVSLPVLSLISLREFLESICLIQFLLLFEG